MCGPTRLLVALAFLTGIPGGSSMATDDAKSWDGTIVQYGTMHEAIGKQQHQGRVLLSELVARPHFFGVAALEKLEGEVTIHDGKVTITGVDSSGQLRPTEESLLNRKATLLAGAYVPSWTAHTLSGPVGRDELDEAIAGAASTAGLDTSKPFVFTVEGEFAGLGFHVINGACPMRARLQKTELPKSGHPFESELEQVHGTIVGVFAAGAVGELTHPGTSTHAHVLFQDKTSGKTVTGHVEWVRLNEGAVLRFPGIATQSSP